MNKNIKHIIREVSPEQSDFSYYFEDEGLTEASGDYCNTLFIVSQSRNSRGFNEDEYKTLLSELDDLHDMYSDIVEESGYSLYQSADEMLLDYGLIDRLEDTKRIKELTDFLNRCYNSQMIYVHYSREDEVAEYLTLKTGKQWATDSAPGYCQGDYVKMIYCSDNYKDGVKNYGEIWLGAGKEFGVIEIDEDGEDGDSCWGYIVADCQAWKDEEYKKLVCEWAGINEDETELQMIDSSRTYTKYYYRTA